MHRILFIGKKIPPINLHIVVSRIPLAIQYVSHQKHSLQMGQASYENIGVVLLVALLLTGYCPTEDRVNNDKVNVYWMEVSKKILFLFDGVANTWRLTEFMINN